MVGRRLGQRQQFGTGVDHQRRQRQLGAQRVHFVEIPLHDQRRLLLRGMLQRVGRDVGIAVAVAADPRTHLQERRQRRGRGTGARLARENLGDVLLHFGHQTRDAVQERGAVIGQRVFDLVDHHQPRVAQHARLPQRGHAGAQLRRVVVALARGHRQVTLGQQAGDLALGVENRLALDFGRMRGQHRHDQRLVQEIAQLLAGHAGGVDGLQRARQAARLRRRSGQRMHAAAAVVVLVFGDIGQMREIAERPHHGIGLVARQPLEQAVEFRAGGAVVLAAEAHRGLADRFHQFEGGVAFLFAHAIAEQTAQEADVLTQRQVVVGTAARRGAAGGVGRHHGQLRFAGGGLYGRVAGGLGGGAGAVLLA
jgi:hypothetical protein